MRNRIEELGNRLFRKRKEEPRQPVSEVEQVWNRYMSQPRMEINMMSMIQDPEVEEVYHRRAIEIMLIPDISRLPYRVNMPGTINNLRFCSWVENMTPKQAEYAALLLPGFMDGAAMELKNKRRSEMAADMLDHYSLIILKLIPRLPVETARELFSRYDIRSRGAVDNFELWKDGGWGPMVRLLESKLPMEFKIAGWKKLREIMLEEKNGKAPRKSHKSAELAHRDLLNNMLKRSRLYPWEERLFEDEVKFALENGTGNLIFDPDLLEIAMDIIVDPEIQLGLWRNIVGCGKNERLTFEVYNDATKSLAVEVMNKFPDEENIVEYLRDQIKAYENYLMEEAKRKAEYVPIDPFVEMRRKPKN